MSSAGAAAEGFNQQRFAAGDTRYQSDVLLQLAQAAAVNADAEKLDTALKLAAQYGVETWQLRAAYSLRRILGGAVLSGGELTGPGEELLQRPAELLAMLPAQLAESAAGGRSAQSAALANLLVLAARCWQVRREKKTLLLIYQVLGCIMYRCLISYACPYVKDIAGRWEVVWGSRQLECTIGGSLEITGTAGIEDALYLHCR